ncbi:MAG: DUF5074 domain-containing protein [Mucinivorans sp.]
MKNKSLWLLAIIISLSFASCKKTEPSIDIPSTSNEVNFTDATNVQTVTFQANQSWSIVLSDTKAAPLPSWLTVSPLSGPAGSATLTLTASGNYSRQERTTYLKIMVDGLVRTIPVKQAAGIKLIADDKATPVVEAKGFFVANEDWFGHDKGTVNRFLKNGNAYTAAYRAYRAANATVSDWFGVNTEYAAIWGDNAYFCSKQGNRLVVADAQSLKKKAIVTDLGGDGRAMVGVDQNKIYVGHSKGIAVFDIAKLQLGKQIEGVSGQIGMMGCIAGRVFAVSQSNGLYVINAKTDVVEKTIAGSFYTMTVAKDGSVWVAGSTKLIKIDPSTLAKEEIDYPAGAKIGSSWGAWNAGGLCASTQQNVLYWTSGGGSFGGGKTVIKYDIATRTATTIYTLGQGEAGVQLEFYGAGLRVDPLSDELILTVKHSGWGASGAYNWIYKLDASGRELLNFKVKGDNGSGLSWAGNAADWDGKYFWFPSIPFFEDVNKPQILLNQVLLKAGERVEVDLATKIVDYDNTSVAIVKTIALDKADLATVSLSGDKLIVEAGNTPGCVSGILTVVSNGVKIDKSIRIDIEQ